jgi:hypothetical protein
MTPPDVMVCKLCGKPVTKDEYCYGCRAYICADHQADTHMGPHAPEDHDD